MPSGRALLVPGVVLACSLSYFGRNGVVLAWPASTKTGRLAMARVLATRRLSCFFANTSDCAKKQEILPRLDFSFEEVYIRCSLTSV